MTDNFDWQAIKADYESGKMSLRKLALTYGVSKTYLIERRDKESWKKPTTDRPTDHTPPVVGMSLARLPMPKDVLSIADLLLSQLARNLQSDMDIRDIKLASDALAACAKVKLTYPAEQEEQDINDGIVLWPAKLLPDTRMEIRRLLEADEQKQREEHVS